MATAEAWSSQRVASLESIGDKQQRVLKALSISTVAELQGAYAASGSRLENLLGGDVRAELSMYADSAPGLVPAPKVGFGAVPPPGLEVPPAVSEQWFWEYVERSDAAAPHLPPPASTLAPALQGYQPGDPGASGPAPGAPDLPAPTVNLIPTLPPIRHQGRRYTCTGHAVGALMDFHFQGHSLGPQFIYWKAKMTDGSMNDRGTWIANCIAQMVSGGSSLEATWPYQPHEISGNESHDPPPPPAVAEAPRFRLPSFVEVCAQPPSPGISSQAVLDHLSTGVPVAISVISPLELWLSNTVVVTTGILTLPLPGMDTRAAHSVCAVGYGESDDMAGGAYLIIRNSWGDEWGTNCSFGVGYGVMPVAYLDEWGLEAYSIPAP